MLDKERENAPISYLDILSLMHFHDINDELAENVAKLIRKSNLVIETERLEIEQYFLPVYRKKGTQQVLEEIHEREELGLHKVRKKLGTEACISTDDILGDELGWITDIGTVQKGIDYFYDKTGVQHYLLICDNLDGKGGFSIMTRGI